MIGRKAELVLNRAVRYAVEQEHEYFTLEHVLWSLLADPKIVETIKSCGGNPGRIRLDLEKYLQNEIPKAAPEQEETQPPNTDRKTNQTQRRDPDADEDSAENQLEHPVATLSIQRLIQRALFHVQSAGKDEIQPEDLLVAIFQAKDSMALLALTQEGIERLDVLNFISHGITPDSPSDPQTENEPENNDETSETEFPQGELTRKNGTKRRPLFSKPGNIKSSDSSTNSEDALSQYTTELNQRARDQKIDPLAGRTVELERITQTLCRRRKNNPLLVGEAGVGKTALAEGLATLIIEKKVSSVLEKAVIYSLDLGSLLAGAKFRGDFEQRFKKVIQALEARKKRGEEPILFIDEIHTIVGAGSVSGGALDAANLIKPLLSSGEIRCMGSTTYAEFRSVFEKDHALARRFQKIEISEPTPEDTIQILNGLKSKFEEHHQVSYTPQAIRAVVELSTKHLTDRFLPDKAIDVLDEAGAKARIQGRSKIDAPEIEEIIAQIARIPARSVNTTQKQRLKNLKSDLQLSIFGQDSAVEALVTAIRLARSGLRSGDRPVGSFLFCGPTGVGKTELSKQLAHNMGVPFLRYDMSEYGEKHTVSRLIGAPPGYVGFEQAGLLTDAISKNPHSVVLLDEIEKAHSDIWNILLQVMDHGFLTDNNGRKADFRNTVLIMTSNVGSREMERRPLGMGESPPIPSKEAQRAVEQTFSPEFRNRLDSIVYFNPLDPETMSQVVSKQLVELETQLLAKNVDIEFTTEVREWLAKKGYDRWMGARPLGRTLQEYIKKPLSEEILFGKLEKGGKVKVSLKNDRCHFDFQPLKALDSHPQSVLEIHV